MVKARNFLAWREGAITDPRGVGQKGNTPPPGVAAEPHSNKDRRSAFGDFFSRRNSLTSMRDWAKGRDSPRRLQREQSGFRYINRPSPTSSPQSTDRTVSSRETLKTKNAVYCALILEEFMKELAAISQEHAVVNLQAFTNVSY
ncbi:hypothetical protein LSAT2_022231 [Lamellibrachia satsuma]|nr:hypothetical protein LSAT2_022231 [Lamellibrachia satsuma]